MTSEQHPVINLSSGTTQISVSQLTGKVVRLCFMARNLLVEPKPSEWPLGIEPNSSNVFNSSVAWGSDECFPNVAASKVWNLRDHGRIWGQQPEILHAQNSSCTALWRLDQVQFKRIIRALSFPNNSAVAGAFEFEMSYPTSIPLIETDEDKHSHLHAAGL
ncbi:MAG: hypothetical protein RJB13_706, partial [Pseudomonadota bacterium]